MTESYYIGAYWGARREIRAACAERLFRMLTELASCHEVVASWKQKANTFREATKHTITPSQASLEALLEAFEPDNPKDFGYHFSAWNGMRASAERATLSTTCGSVPPGPGLCNRIVLELPGPSPAVATLYEPDVLSRILHKMVRAWEPDWAVLISHEYRDKYVYQDDDDDGPPAGKPYLGWMTYLRDKRLSGLTGAPPCEVTLIPERGRIFVVTRAHRFSVANPEDIEGAQTLTDYLEAGGALATIPTDEPF